MNIELNMELFADIVAAFIGAASVICAAKIGTQSIEKIAENHFSSYSEKNYDLYDMMRQATYRITIVSNCGSMLLKNYKLDIEHFLEKGIEIHYLLLEEKTFNEMDTYVIGNNNHSQEAMKSAMDILRDLKLKYNNKLIVKTTEKRLTASYVGVDLKYGNVSFWKKTNPIVQIMLYQFHVNPKNSLTLRLTKKEGKYFDNTVKSIKELWNDAKEITW